MVSKPNGSGPAEVQSNGKGRSWNVHSSKRRMLLVEVEPGIWVHASIDLPYSIRSPPSVAESNAKLSKDHHDALLPDAWLEESIRRAWADWVLLNGCPAHVLSQKAGRAGLERSLEKYFSVWAWSWDLELATNADVVEQPSLFTECIEGFPVVPRAPRSKLIQLMGSDTAKKLKSGKHGERDVVVLSDTLILWPPTDAGCLESEDEEEGDDDSRSALSRTKANTKPNDSSPSQQVIDPQTKAELLRRVVSHLTGLERERDLIRAASVSNTSDARKRGTSGAIRERASTNMNKRDMRNGLLSAGGANKKRVVSSPTVQQRVTSASSFTSSTSEDSTKWSNWGSIFSGLGKLGLRGNADTSMQSDTDSKAAADGMPKDDPEVADLSIVTSEHIEADTSVAEAAAPCSSSPVEAPSNGKDASAGEGRESSSPLHLFQQRLTDAIPIQEAGGKMWNGAELVVRGVSASLGLTKASAGSVQQDQADTSVQNTLSNPAQDADVSDTDRFADASFDTNGAEADASVVTKVSILEPEVDVSQLAEALGVDQDAAMTARQVMPAMQPANNSGADSSVDDKEAGQQKGQALKLDTHSVPTESSESGAISPANETHASDAASIRTSASAKAFPSISVTSAAWYNTKALRSDVAAASPKLATAACIVHSAFEKPNADCKDTPEPVDTSLSGVSVQSEHHDFELDGWGYEQPQAFQSFRCYVGESDVAISYESLALLQKDPFECDEYRVSFTTRRLLTLVLIERVPSTTGPTLAAPESDPVDALEDAWQVLRRTQRILNDYDRIAKRKGQDEDPAVRFLHLDGPTLTVQSSLEDAANKMEPDVQVVADAHCVSAMELMRRHGVVETFSRSSNGKTWTASRQGTAKTKGPQNQTYMVLAGKKISIVDCDTELRKLANQYPSFGI